MIKLNCPKCGTQMRSYDNESLFHPSIKDVADGIPPIDGVIYVLVLCDNCGHKHNQEFDIVLREQPKVQNDALQDAYATLLRWRESCPEMWDERDDLTLENVIKAKGKPKVPTQMVSCPKCGNDTEKPIPELVQPDTYGEVNCTCGNVYYYPLKNLKTFNMIITKDKGKNTFTITGVTLGELQAIQGAFEAQMKFTSGTVIGIEIHDAIYHAIYVMLTTKK